MYYLHLILDIRRLETDLHQFFAATTDDSAAPPHALIPAQSSSPWVYQFYVLIPIDITSVFSTY